MPTVNAIIRINAEDNTKQGTAGASKAFKDLGSDLKDFAGDFAPISIAAGAILASAVKTAAGFESQMTIMAIAARNTGVDVNQLRDYALKMGAETVFSASEAADAMT